MKALVVGGGSIGKRHLQNLQALGMEELGLVETDGVRASALSSELPLRCFAELSSGLDWDPDFAIVATPTDLHASHAADVIRRGCDIFIEKPLCHTAVEVDQLCALEERWRPISLVGCNMRFHPGLARVKELLEQETIGKILFARLHCGSYLPEWRAGVDYRENYAATERRGGGCILDCIHELDLAGWFAGEVIEVTCMAGHLSSLEIATEDVAALICRHESGAISEIHLDYVQRTYERGCEIVGEKGSIFWEFSSGQVRRFDADAREWTIESQPCDWQTNSMYLDEVKHFIECVQRRRPSVLPISTAASVMQVAFAAKQSAREGRIVSTRKEVVV